jgi:hypothetical protein
MNKNLFRKIGVISVAAGILLVLVIGGVQAWANNNVTLDTKSEDSNKVIVSGSTIVNTYQVASKEKAYSAVQQDSIWIKDKKGLDLTLRIRWNEKQITKTDMDGKERIEYEYDEQEIIYTIPDNVKLADFNTYLSSILPTLLTKAKEEANGIMPIKSTTVETIRQYVDTVKIKADMKKVEDEFKLVGK